MWSTTQSHLSTVGPKAQQVRGPRAFTSHPHVWSDATTLRLQDMVLKDLLHLQAVAKQNPNSSTCHQKIQNGLQDTDRWEEAKDCGDCHLSLSILEVYLYPYWPQTEINTICVTCSDKFYMSRCLLVEHASLLRAIQSLASLSAHSFHEQCRGMYFLPRPSCGYCLPPCQEPRLRLIPQKKKRKVTCSTGRVPQKSSKHSPELHAHTRGHLNSSQIKAVETAALMQIAPQSKTLAVIWNLIILQHFFFCFFFVVPII